MDILDALIARALDGSRTINVSVSGTTPTIKPEAARIYNCGLVSTLKIEDPPENGRWVVVFESGSTATTTDFPETVLGLEDFAAEANKIYEINVWDNRALFTSWEVSSS